MKLTKWSLDRPRITFLMLALVFLAGIYSLSAILKEGDPDIQIPMSFITIVYPGASPTEIEDKILDPLEDELADLSDLDYLYANASEGVCWVQVIFDVEAEFDTVLADVQKRVDSVKSEFPEDALEPNVMEFSLSDIPVITLSLSAEMNALDLRRLGDDLADQLQRITGVLEVDVTGGQEREVQVLLAPAKLAQYNLSPAQVIQAIKSQHVNIPSGGVEIGDQRYLVRAIGEFTDPSELGDLIVTGAVDPRTGRPTRVRLSDIAEIIDGAGEPETYSRANGQDAVNLSIKRRSNANVLVTTDAIKHALGIPSESMTVELANGNEVKLRPDQIRTLYFANQDSFTIQVTDVGTGETTDVRRGEVLEQLNDADIDPSTIIPLPSGVEIQVMTDQSDEVNDTLKTMGDNVLQGVLLVFLVLLLFMGTRTAVLVSSALPLSMLIATAVLFFTDNTLNSMTMSGMILVVGMLVDNAIVITQNIYRHIEKGDDRTTAAVKGTSELAYPVATSTLTTVFAFMPMLLMGGMMGKYMGFIPITVTIALFASLFVGLILIPPIAAKFLKLKAKPGEWKQHGSHGLMLRVHRLRMWLDKVFNFDRLMKHYDRLIRGAIRHRKLVFFLTLFAFIGAVALPMTGVIKIDLFPPSDTDTVTIALETPVGTTLEVTDAKVRQIEEIVVANVPELERHVSAAGDAARGGHRISISLGLAPTNRGWVTMKLVPGDDRERTAAEISEALRPELDKITGSLITFVMARSGPPTGSAIDVKVYGTDFDEQRRIANQLVAFLEELDGVRDVDTDISPGTPELKAWLRRDEAAILGFSSYDLAMSLRQLISGVEATNFEIDDNDIAVNVKLPSDAIKRISDLESLYITNMAGRRVMVGDIAHIERGEGVSDITHYNSNRAVTVNGDLLPHVSSMDITRMLQSYVDSEIALPPGYWVDYEGSFKFIEESFNDLFNAFFLAILLIFLLLTLQFRSLAQPIVVMVTIPLAVVGAMVGLAVTGSAFTIIAFVGIIGLAGVVVNGAIVLVDFINIRRREGASIHDAIVDAGKVRLTPILLTTITTIGGMLPLALSDPEWAPLGYAFIFGLATGTVLTLVVVPTFYSWIEDWKIRVKKKIFRKNRQTN